MDATFHLATTDAEREAVFRLRYEIYVEEMHIFGAVADHTRRMFIDAHDATARLMYARVDGEIVGTMRLNLGGDAPFPEEFEQTYNLGLFRPAITDAQILILTRFMVKKEYRGTPLAFMMIGEAARIATKEGIEVSLCDCQPHLINLYTRLGFRSYECPVYNDPEFGIMIPLALVMGDLDYLKRIRSPVAALIAQGSFDGETVAQLVPVFGSAAVQSTRGDGAAERWGEVYGLLGEHEGGRVRLFDGLTEEEVQSVVARGHLIDCAPGDRIIRQGQPARTVFVVLSGSLEVRDDGRLLGVKPDGDVVGELAFLLGRRRTADVYAGAAGARVMSLDEHKLRQLVETPSRVAAVLLLNLSRVLALKLAETSALVQA